jgi:NAD(P) transhydrogenase subunit alpha
MDRAGLDPFGQRKPAWMTMPLGGFEALAMEFMPRITRAQSMDILSSQSNLSGYKAVIDSAGAFGRAFPMMMTAAGTITAARVFIMGVGVAGLAGDCHRATSGRHRVGNRRALRDQGAD